AVTNPYPGAFTYLSERKIIVWRAHVLEKSHDKLPGTIISAYMGYQTKKIIKCFKEYDVDVAISRAHAVFDQVKNNNVEETPILQKSGVYKLGCKECDKV
ncbi:MAG: hypothetical protein ACTS85_04420, partial [Arsenophonus sp. NC-PG7-MAG3]